MLALPARVKMDAACLISLDQGDDFLHTSHLANLQPCFTCRVAVSNYGDQTEVFILRIWIEPREREGAAPEWRGYIENVASGEKRYLHQLEEIGLYLMPYLEKHGIRPGAIWRLARRFRGRPKEPASQANKLDQRNRQQDE